MTKASKRGEGKPGRREPTGHEVMKRTPPSDWVLRPARFEFDPKKAYSAEQLAEIGAISVKWNQLEAHIDFICSQILFAKTPIWLRLSMDRALNTQKKLELPEECVAKAKLLDEAAKQCITDTFFHFKTYRSYRNAIVHHHIFDHEKGIGSYIDESKKPFQIMVSIEALKNFYRLICILLEEIRQVDLLFRIETDAQRPGRTDPKTHKFEPFQTTQLREQIIPDMMREALRLQKQRKSLPPLPKFPDADLERFPADRNRDSHGTGKGGFLPSDSAWEVMLWPEHIHRICANV